MGPKCYHKCPYKRERGRRSLDTLKEGYARVKTEIGVMWPEARECQQPPETEKGKKQISRESLQRKCGSADTLALDFWLPKL